MRLLTPVKKSITLYGVVSAIVLGAAAALTFFVDQPASAFMRIRGGILLAVAPLLVHWASQAAQDNQKSFERLRTVTSIMPIAVIGVDLIPGMCPTGYAVMQGISVLPLIGVAVMVRGPQLRAAFGKTKKA
ncbi:hypothetical protein GCM10009765_07560 [Fodinicola feengrottensis]|uniref:Uncharacterized protein n=1 Tax=Fodinicola feengrottensis TaxID=435914 RepID=A0ABP4RRK5_9ACTN